MQSTDVNEARPLFPMAHQLHTCIWELTLACNLQCRHCGSRAGKARPAEMSLEKCIEVARELASLGCARVTLSGGEPTLKQGWEEIAAALSQGGVYVNMITNAAYGSRAAAIEVGRKALAAGMGNIGVSLDGTEALHDELRGAGVFAQTLESLEAFATVGLKTAVLTTITEKNFEALPEIRRIAMEAGARIWRLQLALPMGVLEEQRAWVIHPRRLVELMPLLADLSQQKGIKTMLSDSVGYYGPFDRVLRGGKLLSRRSTWRGCQAGLRVIGIEADGGVKGCLSMQAPRPRGADTASDSFREGNLHTQSLAEIWGNPEAFAYNRRFQLSALKGTCAKCRFAAVCRGGARCVAAATGNTLAENAYCYAAQTGLWYKPPTALRNMAVGAAAAMLLSGGAMLGCDDEVRPAPSDVQDGGADQDVIGVDVLYGLPEDMTDVQPPYGLPEDIQPPYGLPDDVDVLYGVPDDLDDGMVDVDEVDMHPLYGVDAEEGDVEPPYGLPEDMAPAYGLPDDVVD